MKQTVNKGHNVALTRGFYSAGRCVWGLCGQFVLQSAATYTDTSYVWDYFPINRLCVHDYSNWLCTGTVFLYRSEIW